MAGGFGTKTPWVPWLRPRVESPTLSMSQRHVSPWVHGGVRPSLSPFAHNAHTGEGCRCGPGLGVPHSLRPLPAPPHQGACPWAGHRQCTEAQRIRKFYSSTSAKGRELNERRSAFYRYKGISLLQRGSGTFSDSELLECLLAHVGSILQVWLHKCLLRKEPGKMKTPVWRDLPEPQQRPVLLGEYEKLSTDGLRGRVGDTL